MMKSVKDMFDSLSPSESQIDHMYHEINRNRATSSYHFSFTRYALVGSIIIFILICTCSVVLYMNRNNNQDNHQQISINNNPIDEEETVFGEFIVTTYLTKVSQEYLGFNYVEESKGSKLSPKTKLLLPDYSLTSSMTPGFPFTFELSDSDSDVVTLKIQVDNGQFLTWNSESGKVSEIGSIAMSRDVETLYWSPIMHDSKNTRTAREATIKVMALEKDKIIATQEILITESDDRYYAELGELNIIDE